MLKLNYGGEFSYEVTDHKQIEELIDAHICVQEGFEDRIRAAIGSDRFKKVAVLEPGSLKFFPCVSGTMGEIKFRFIFSPTGRGYFRLFYIDLKNFLRLFFATGGNFGDIFHDIF